jgi:Amt family ammonium transporter
MLGVMLTGIFVAGSLGGLGFAEGKDTGSQLWVQFVGVVATFVWSAVLTYIVLKIVDLIAGLRVSDDQETEGLDITAHGERGYNL